MQQYNVKISSEEITKWFRSQGFKPVVFKNGKTYISSFWNGQTTTVKLKHKAGYETYFKKAYGSAILVFDVTIHNRILMYEGYVPMLLFAFWNKKISFKKDASGIFKYRSEGFEVEEKFKVFLEKKVI